VRHIVFSSPLYHRGHLRSGQNISGTVKPGFPSEYFFSPKFSLCLDISRDVSTLLGHSRCFSMVLGRSRSRLGASFATLAVDVYCENCEDLSINHGEQRPITRDYRLRRSTNRTVVLPQPSVLYVAIFTYLAMRDYLFKERLTLVTGYHLINGRDDGPKVLVWCKRSQTNTSDQVAEAREVVGTLNNVWPSDSKLSQSVVAILL
jgi:hypothetical protein